jgi:peptidoglycan/LPS O-acetylase OafA/YrhL
MTHEAAQLATHTASRQNNLDLLRLLAAAGVMALHVVDLAAQPALAWLHMPDTKWALSIFFVLSGYLVYQSAEQTASWRAYAVKRLRRIVPAYVAVVVLMVLAGAWLSTWPPARYWGAEVWRYLWANLLFLNFLAPRLPGVFEGNTLPAVNGALWTIKVELMFYATVPVLMALVRRFGHHKVLGLGYVLSCIWWGGCWAMAYRTGNGSWVELSKQLPGQLMYFLPGVWCYIERERLMRWGWRVGVAGAVLMAVAQCFDGASTGPGGHVYPLALAALVFWSGFILRWLGSVTRWGDLSYGIYIWHFPVIQILVQLGVFKSSPWIALGLLLLSVVMLAWLSWHLVEAPALGRRRVAQQAQHGRPSLG